MKRFYPLSVDRLEDRWVPTAIADVEAVAAAQVLVVDVSTDPTAGTVVIETPNDNTMFVIDVPPVDPNGLPDNPLPPDDQPTNPDPGWDDPTEPVPPIDDPFWF